MTVDLVKHLPYTTKFKLYVSTYFRRAELLLWSYTLTIKW